MNETRPGSAGSAGPTGPDGSIELITDFSLRSYVVIGRLYRLTLETLGLNVNERPLTNESNLNDFKNKWALSNTIGPRFTPVPGAFNIALPAHEWSRYPKEWVKRLNGFDEVWTTTDHVKTLLEASGVKAPIFKMPPALDIDKTATMKMDWTGKKPFRFFSCGEAHFRKGFHLLMAGFMRAFPEPGSAALTIKTSPDCDWISPREDIRIEVTEMDRDDLLHAYSTYDAYVSASLGEGLGLPVAEAVLAKTPVTANFWGGHASILTEGGYWRIEHEEAPQLFCSNPGYYAQGQKCAYSSSDRISAALRDVYE
ncbi:hypothetical protein MNBD_NITROSPINAE04-2280, partial [hydrothermal vent metagenome]